MRRRGGLLAGADADPEPAGPRVQLRGHAGVARRALQPRELHQGRNAVRIQVEGPVPLLAEVTAAAVADLHLAVGDQAWASVKASEITVTPA